MSLEMEKRGRGRPKTLDQQRTIEIAMTSYWCDGVREVSINEICRRADVSKPSVYRVFGSEDGLMAAAVAHYRNQVVAPILTLLSSNERFDVVLAHLLTLVTEGSGRPAGCLVAELRSSSSGVGPETTALVDEIAADLRLAYSAWFERARAYGTVNPAIPTDLATHFIDTQLTTVLLQIARGHDPALTRAQATLAFSALQVPSVVPLQPPTHAQQAPGSVLPGAEQKPSTP